MVDALAVWVGRVPSRSGRVAYSSRWFQIDRKAYTENMNMIDVGRRALYFRMGKKTSKGLCDNCLQYKTSLQHGVCGDCALRWELHNYNEECDLLQMVR